jgi:ankyrin repeat protein
MIALALSGLGASASPDPSVANLAEQGDLPGVRALVEAGADVNLAQPDGATALHWAAHWNDLALTKLLLTAGAKPNTINDYAISPAYLAALNGSAEMLDLLIEAGADPDAVRPTGETVLMTAVRSGSNGAVARLLQAGASPDAVQASRGQAALMWAVADGHVRLAETLLGAGADITLRSSAGYTPLMFAARQGSVDMAKLLLSKGDDLEATASDGTTPLLIATVKGHTPLATFFIERGARPDGDAKAAGYTPLMWAVGTFEVIPMTYKGIVADGEWGTFTGIPDRVAKLAFIRLLLAKGADVNAKGTTSLPQMSPHNGGGATPPHPGAPPLLVAAQSADAQVMRMLLAAGADPTITARDGQTALMAASEGVLENTMLLTEDIRIEALEVAFDAGVPLEAEDRGGYRAMHVAARAGYHDIITFLLSKGADLNPVSKPVKGSGLARHYQEGQSPLGLTEGTLSGIFLERPDTADFLRALGAKSIGRFSPHDYEAISPEESDKKLKAAAAAGP